MVYLCTTKVSSHLHQAESYSNINVAGCWSLSSSVGKGTDHYVMTTLVTPNKVFLFLLGFFYFASHFFLPGFLSFDHSSSCVSAPPSYMSPVSHRPSWAWVYCTNLSLCLHSCCLSRVLRIFLYFWVIYLFIYCGFFFFGLAHSEVNNLNSSLIRSDFWKILWVLINLKKTIGVLGSILKTFTNTSYTQMLNQLSLCSGFIGTETRQRQRLMAASLL